MLSTTISEKTFQLLVPAFALAAAAFAQRPRYDEIFDHYRAAQNFNGAALVASNGSIEYVDGAGLAHRPAGSPLTAKTKFRKCARRARRNRSEIKSNRPSRNRPK